MAATRILRRDVPPRPKHSLFWSSGEDRVYDSGPFCWRYRQNRLWRFLEYDEDGKLLRVWNARRRKEA